MEISSWYGQENELLKSLKQNPALICDIKTYDFFLNKIFVFMMVFCISQFIYFVCNKIRQNEIYLYPFLKILF